MRTETQQKGETLTWDHLFPTRNSAIFFHEAYRGYQPVAIDRSTLAAMHYPPKHSGGQLPSEIIMRRRVTAESACDAIAKFQVWQADGHADTFLTDVGNATYTVVLKRELNTTTAPRCS